MDVTLELPEDIEDQLRRENPNLNSELREAVAIALFRKSILNHYQLSRTLGLDRFETDALLQRHGVTEQSLTSADVEADLQTLRRVLGPVK
jgi:predicted HTH domain antitoxin